MFQNTANKNNRKVNNADTQPDFSLLKLRELINTDAPLHEDSYLYSLPYYALTGRRGAWLCQGYGSISVVCAHPHLDKSFLLFPELGRSDGNLTLHVLTSWPPERGRIQLARFTDHDLDTVRQKLAQKNNTPVKAITEIAEPDMDWRYPLHILNTAQVAEMQGPAFRNVRQKCRKITGEVEIIPFGKDKTKTAENMRYIRSCLKYWEGNMILRREDWRDENSEFYHHLLSLMESWPEMFDGYAMMYEGKIRGFTVWDCPIPKTANLLANITDITISGFSEYQMVTTCRLLSDKGITRLNRGGSESRGLDSFKQKFAPIKSLELKSATIEFSHDFTPVSVLPLVPPDWH